jgi:lipopolysaccharide export LptBFGC system permease protein LptF
MWKIHRYYLKEISVNAVLTFAILFGIALISLLYKGIRLVQGGDLIDAAITTLLLAADILPHLLTFSVMFGTVLTFARASQEREVTALRSLGISPRVPMVASLLIGLLCSIVATWGLHYQIPWAHYHKYRVVADIYQSKLEKYIDNQDRIELDKDGVMTWQKQVKDGDQEVYVDVSIYSGSGRQFSGLGDGMLGKGATLVIADRVWFEMEEAQPDITMHIHGLYLPLTEEYFENFPITMNLHEMLRSKTRNAGDRDLASDSLLSEVYRDAHRDPIAAQYTVHRRACFALMSFLLAPIGFCIGVLSRERGRVLALSFCMIPLSLVYLTDFLGESILRHAPYPLLGWLPALVVLMLGLPFCWRLLRV